MHITRLSRFVSSILAVCLVGLIVVAVPHFRASAHSVHTSIASDAAQHAISTTCPAPGTARAAVMPPITLGTQPTIVYIVNEYNPRQPNFGTLKRYDIVTGSKVEIIKFADKHITSAQISANGQWLLFESQAVGQEKLQLQLIRMDGQFLQTLYCGGAIGEVQWSTDQRLVVFSDFGGIYLLNMTTGALQIEVSLSGVSTSVHPRTWLDHTRVYVTLQRPDGPPESLAILDTTKGPNQKLQDLQQVFDASSSTPFCWDFDSSFDATRLFVSQCTTRPGGLGGGPAHGPSVLTLRPPTGFSYTYLYVSQGLAFTTVRAVSSSTLLFTVRNTSGDTSQNGLWKVGTDGSHPQRLTTSGQLNQFTQFPWSNVSRDGHRYVLQIISGTLPSTTFTLEYGSLSGGSPFVFASITNVQLATVGWTTM